MVQVEINYRNIYNEQANINQPHHAYLQQLHAHAIYHHLV